MYSIDPASRAQWEDIEEFAPYELNISNGEEIVFRVAFKPTATLIQNQATVDKDGNETELMGRGRHDPCVVPRAVPIVESMVCLVLADHWLRQRAVDSLPSLDSDA